MSDAIEPMTLEQAQTAVAPHVGTVNQYRAVVIADALLILGEERLARLLADPVRKHGPTRETIYPWNIEAYLMQPDLRKAKP